MRLGLRYDLRSLDDSTRAQRYRTMLDQCEWADAHGFDYVRLNEHHSSPDGYLPSPLVVAAAIAARTTRLRIRITALLLPLHDPLRIAEDAAVADLVSDGRLDLVVGAGYRPVEFEMFDRLIDDRVALLEEGINTLRQAWRGEPFQYRGRTVRVTPRPAKGSIPLYLGGSSKGAARRAARIADGFEPSSPDLAAEYLAERARIGRTDNDERVRATASGAMRFMHVTTDPAGDWSQLIPFALHEMQSYGSWANESDKQAQAYHEVASLAELEQSGVYRVMTPAECIDYAGTVAEDDALEQHPLMGGMPVELGWQSLRLLESDVLPAIRAGR